MIWGLTEMSCTWGEQPTDCSAPPMASRATPTRIGIPFALQLRDAAGAYVRCPVCNVRVNLIERKDFESFTRREYAQHYAAKHAENLPR
jgi:hypothetical protein